MTKTEIQLIRSLEDKRAREEAGLFVAEGEKLVRELLASDFRVRKVYFTTPSKEFGFLVTRSFGEGGLADFEQAAPKDMERASHLKTPTDVLALVEIPRRALSPSQDTSATSGDGRRSVDETFDPLPLRDRLVLALDGVQNPGNMGTIIRLADWFGVADILCSADCADCFNPKVVQATMGAITRVAVHYGDLAEMIGAVGNANISAEGVPTPVFGTFLEGVDIYGSHLSSAGIVVLGSEGRGISPEIERLVGHKLFIPPYPSDRRGAESLNVAIAAAIVCSEFRRR